MHYYVQSKYLSSNFMNIKQGISFDVNILSDNSDNRI